MEKNRVPAIFGGICVDLPDDTGLGRCHFQPVGMILFRVDVWWRLPVFVIKSGRSGRCGTISNTSHARAYRGTYGEMTLIGHFGHFVYIPKSNIVPFVYIPPFFCASETLIGTMLFR